MKVPAMTLKESVKHVCTCGEGIKGFATQNVTSPASPPPKKKKASNTSALVTSKILSPGTSPNAAGPSGCTLVTYILCVVKEFKVNTQMPSGGLRSILNQMLNVSIFPNSYVRKP